MDYHKSYPSPRWVRIHQGVCRRFEALSWALLKGARAGSDFQKLWFDSFVNLAEKRSSFEKVIGFIEGSEKLKGLQIDQDRRWNLVQRLYRIGYPNASKYLAREQKRDPTHSGKKEALTAQVIAPDLRVKKKWMAEIHDENSKLTVSEQKTIMRSIFPPEQDELKQHFQDDYFSYVKKYSKKSDAPEFLDTYSETLVPALCNLSSTKELQNFLSKTRGLPAYVEKNIKISIDENERCRKIKSKAVIDMKSGHKIL